MNFTSKKKLLTRFYSESSYFLDHIYPAAYALNVQKSVYHATLSHYSPPPPQVSRCQARYRPSVDYPSGDVDGRNGHSRRRVVASPLNVGGASDYQKLQSLSTWWRGKLGSFFRARSYSLFFFSLFILNSIYI